MKFFRPMVEMAAVLVLAILALFALRQVSSSGFDLNSNHQLANIRGYLRNPLAYLLQRSPGARGSGGLTQTKHRMFKAPRIANKPQERVLSNVRYAPVIPNFVNDLVPNPAPGPLIPPSFPILPGPPVAPLVTPPPVVPPVVIPPGGGGGGGTVNPAVPEPSTWLMLIWGMALVGIGLRSKQRAIAKRRVRSGFRALR